MLKVALIGLCLCLMVSPALADFILKGQFRAPCKMTPPAYALNEPTVPFDLFVWPQSKVQRVCANGAKTYQPITACAMPPGRAGNNRWFIAMSSFLDDADYACVLVYEKAHLPPNNWQDQAWEDAGFKGTEYAHRADAVVTP